MESNIWIRGIEVYHPEDSKKVDDYIESFRKKGEDIEFQIREFMGKENLYRIKDNAENSLTMAIKASKKVLETSGINGNEIDMIVLSSMLPEYVSPPSALIIHDAINGKENAICYDININCIGMTFALNQVYRQMQSEPSINKVLLVGSEYNSFTTGENNPIMSPNVGDAACAIIIERTSEACGVISTKYYIEKGNIEKSAFPGCGSSHIYNATKEEMISRFEIENVRADTAVNYIKEILTENDLRVEDIAMYCFSQFAIYHTLFIRNELGISDEKSIYIGDKYGYTGTTSPFIVLYEAIKQNKVKHGDYVLFWTVGAATQHIFVLIKY